MCHITVVCDLHKDKDKDGFISPNEFVVHMMVTNKIRHITVVCDCK